MAQIIIKGFVVKDLECKQVGKDNKVDYVRMLIVDDTILNKDGKGVLFGVDAFGDLVRECKTLKAGSKVMVKATVVDNTYTDNAGVKHTGVAYRLYEKPVLTDEKPQDLFDLYDQYFK